jgi:hypothetical protein
MEAAAASVCAEVVAGSKRLSPQPRGITVHSSSAFFTTGYSREVETCLPPGPFDWVATNHTNPMKQTILTTALSVLAAGIMVADEKAVTTTTTTTGMGTITEYAPGKTFILKEKAGPVTYHYGDKVTYVTRKGRTLSDDEVRTHIKVGSAASVHYTTSGSDRVINRVEIDDD